MQGLMHLTRASHGHPRTPYAVNKDHPRASTMPHSCPRPMRTPCVRPAASPDVHVHACSDVVTCSRPRPPDMHGRSVLDAHDPSCPPACPHLAASPDAHAHSPPSSFPRLPSTTTDVHAPTSAHCPSLSQQRRGDNDDATIVPLQLISPQYQLHLSTIRGTLAHLSHRLQLFPDHPATISTANFPVTIIIRDILVHLLRLPQLSRDHLWYSRASLALSAAIPRPSCDHLHSKLPPIPRPSAYPPATIRTIHPSVQPSWCVLFIIPGISSMLKASPIHHQALRAHARMLTLIAHAHPVHPFHPRTYHPQLRLLHLAPSPSPSPHRGQHPVTVVCCCSTNSA
ncbi:hypothetical protein EV363DRAFT_1579107 [Boletus edulis]|nr:hypothetical protein EV363DRAFT_1579107 [Boletus edulis]